MSQAEKNFKYGLKLWSTNDNYLAEAVRLFNLRIYDFIELYVVPGSGEKHLGAWAAIKVPYVIHAPHWRDGLNLAKAKNEEKNAVLIGEARRFADILNSNKIVVHPGIDGDIKETTRQLRTINDRRILIENKPYYALDDGLMCNGATPKEIGYVISEAGVGFCLDLGHAIVAANGHGKDSYGFLADFISLKPALYHLADGDSKGVYDKHQHFGKGNFDLTRILELLPADAMVTVETVKDHLDKLDDFEQDIRLVRELERKSL